MRAKAAETARTKHLDALAKRAAAAWTDLEVLVAKSNYDAAVPLAIDLRDLRDTSAAGQGGGAVCDALWRCLSVYVEAQP